MMISHDPTPAADAGARPVESAEQHDLESLIAAHRKSLADSEEGLAAMRGVHDRAKHEALEKAYNAQVDAEDGILRDIFAHPCRTLAEVQRKAAYLLSDPNVFDCVDPDMTRDLVKSLANAPA